MKYFLTKFALTFLGLALSLYSFHDVNAKTRGGNSSGGGDIVTCKT